MKYPALVAVPVFISAMALACSGPDDKQPASDSQVCRTPVLTARPSMVTPEGTPHLQSPDEAAAQDASLIAQAQGITPEQAEAQLKAAEGLDGVSTRIAAERPDIFIGSALSSDGGPPKLYIKGPADDFVRSLVAGAGIEIQIVDNQPYSRAELDDRQAWLVRALQEQGFTNLGAGSDITKGGEIEAAVTRQTGLPDDPDEILAGLPADLREGVTLTVSDAPLGCLE